MDAVAGSWLPGWLKNYSADFTLAGTERFLNLDSFLDEHVFQTKPYLGRLLYIFVHAQESGATDFRAVSCARPVSVMLCFSSLVPD
jgi:hypothetical protein